MKKFGEVAKMSFKLMSDFDRERFKDYTQFYKIGASRGKG